MAGDSMRLTLDQSLLSDIKRAANKSKSAAAYGGRMTPDKVFSSSENLLNVIKGITHGSVSGEEHSVTMSFTHEAQEAPYTTSPTVIGLWHCDGDSLVTGTDESDNGNDLQLTDCTRATGKWGSCLGFNGTSSNATTALSSAEPVSKFLAFSVWVNPDSVTGVRPICYIEDALSLFIEDGILKLTITDGTTPETIVSELSVATSAWQNIAFQFNEGSVYLAVDDLLYLGTTTYTTTDPAGSSIVIGSDTSNFFDGNIDEILLKANVMIEDDQPIFTSTGWLNDVIFWPFFENTGTTVHGTNILMPTLELNGGTWAVGRNNYAAQFDGISQYASSSVTAETFSNKKLSICVAIRFDADAACQIISQVDGINMEYTGTHIRANITGVTEGATDIAKLDVNTTDWYFISVQYDGSYKTCYVNGQKMGEVAATGTPVMSDSTMNLATNGAKTEFGACTIDFVRIYRNELFPYVRPIQYMCAGQTGALSNEEWVVK